MQGASVEDWFHLLNPEPLLQKIHIISEDRLPITPKLGHIPWPVLLTIGSPSKRFICRGKGGTSSPSFCRRERYYSWQQVEVGRGLRGVAFYVPAFENQRCHDSPFL